MITHLRVHVEPFFVSAKPNLLDLRREHQFPRDCTDKSFVEHGMSWTQSSRTRERRYGGRACFALLP